MDVVEVADTVSDYLRRYNLTGWQFKLTSGRRVLGNCNYGKMTIGISRYHIEHGTRREILDTIRHEIAHAIVGPGHGHGYVWQVKAQELGAIPKPSKAVIKLPPQEWELVCGCCRRVIDRRHRRMNAGKLSSRYHISCGKTSKGKLFFRKSTLVNS